VLIWKINMNKVNKTLNYFAIGLGGLSLLATQLIFANDSRGVQTPSTNTEATKDSGELSSMFSNQEALRLPDFAIKKH